MVAASYSNRKLKADSASCMPLVLLSIWLWGPGLELRLRCPSISIVMIPWVLQWVDACTGSPIRCLKKTTKNKLRGLSLRTNYNDRVTAACRRNKCQLLRIEGATWSACRIPTAVFSVSRPEPLLFLPSSSSVVLTRLSRPRSRPTTSQNIW
jgi:hypothetical protein